MRQLRRSPQKKTNPEPEPKPKTTTHKLNTQPDSTPAHQADRRFWKSEAYRPNSRRAGPPNGPRGTREAAAPIQRQLSSFLHLVEPAFQPNYFSYRRPLCFPSWRQQIFSNSACGLGTSSTPGSSSTSRQPHLTRQYVEQASCQTLRWLLFVVFHVLTKSPAESDECQRRGQIVLDADTLSRCAG
jgi:hypothetical protein